MLASQKIASRQRDLFRTCFCKTGVFLPLFRQGSSNARPKTNNREYVGKDKGASRIRNSNYDNYGYGGKSNFRGQERHPWSGGKAGAHPWSGGKAGIMSDKGHFGGHVGPHSKVGEYRDLQVVGQLLRRPKKLLFGNHGCWCE